MDVIRKIRKIRRVNERLTYSFGRKWRKLLIIKDLWWY
jgi:hypothetical protein